MVLLQSPVRLFWSLLVVVVTRPLRFMRGLAAALQLGSKSRRGIARHLAYLIESCLLLQRLGDVSHLHTHFGTNSASVAYLTHVLGGPSYSLTIHGPEEFDDLFSRALFLKIDRASFVVTVSQYGYAQLLRLRAHTQLHVVHCGVNSIFLDEGITSVPGARQIICIGRLVFDKGHMLLLDAIRRIDDVQLVLVGDGPERSELAAKIEQFGLADRVTMTGWLSEEDVRDHIDASDLGVSASLAENLPVVLMEVLARGRPVVAPHIAGIPELVIPGKTGWLVPPADVEALSASIQEALNLPSEALDAMGKRGRRLAEEQFNAAHETLKLLDLFEHVNV